MAFQITPNVHVDSDDSGVARHLAHLQAPYLPPSVAATSPRALADQYLHEVAPLYRLDPALLTNLDAPLEGKLSDVVTQLRFAAEKQIFETTVISYVQTHYGLPIWEAGVSITLHSQPLRVTSSQSTIHLDVTVKKPAAKAKGLPPAIKPALLGDFLGLGEKGDRPRVNATRLLIYRYDSSLRLDPEATTKRRQDIGAPEATLPTLPLPRVPDSIVSGNHYVVTEVLFTFAVGDFGDVNWRAFVEAETGIVLYLRAFLSCATGYVYTTDPLTASGGTTPSSPTATLNAFRTSVALQGLTPPPPATPQALSGNFVQLADTSPPPIAAPTEITADFLYDVPTDNFSAVNAYHTMDGFFRMMEAMGFNIATFFDGTVANPGFPVPVDHRGLGSVVNAQGPGNTTGDGSGGFKFALAQVGTTVGIADDARVSAHEFCHALLWDSVHSPNFGFAHSAGDSLGALINDPGSKAPDRFLTFPWIASVNPWAQERRHDRPVGGGWAWGGVNDFGGYSSEQILATSLFRVYRMTGGDCGSLDAAIKLATQQFASRYLVYVIIRAIGSLATSPVTPTPNVSVYVTKLMEADTQTSLPNFAGIPGGTIHKVIRWGFEKQGLFQPPGAPTPVTSEGAPPAVDVYINDGRNGEYAPYLDDFTQGSDVWNRVTSTPGAGPGDHQTPIIGVTNFAYVNVKNRGSQTANDVVVNAYRCKPGTAMVWPADWQALNTASLPVPAGIPPGGSVTVGPFRWTPTEEGHECLLMSVSATGDLSNANAASLLPCAAGPTPAAQLVPFDNNIAMRDVAPIHGPDPCTVELEPIDDQCISPAAPRWLPYTQCFYWYETRFVGRFPVVFRVVYRHCACLVGRQQGPLLYTTTLLPGESVRLYHYDRHRRTHSAKQTWSVHTSWRQYVAATHRTRSVDSTSEYQKFVVSASLDGDTTIDVGGALFPVSWSSDDFDSLQIKDVLTASVDHVAEDFHETLAVSSQQVDTERSIVISSYEESETIDVTSRTVRNDNDCYAVTYFVRRVYEAYDICTEVYSIEWAYVRQDISRAAAAPALLQWRRLDDQDGVDKGTRELIRRAALVLPKIGQEVHARNRITLPTDGVVYEPELAHCSSCEPQKEAEHQIALEKAKAEERKLCLEAELLAIELKRRQQLLEKGVLDPFEPPPSNPAPPGQ